MPRPPSSGALKVQTDADGWSTVGGGGGGGAPRPVRARPSSGPESPVALRPGGGSFGRGASGWGAARRTKQPAEPIRAANAFDVLADHEDGTPSPAKGKGKDGKREEPETPTRPAGAAGAEDDVVGEDEAVEAELSPEVCDACDGLSVCPRAGGGLLSQS